MLLGLLLKKNHRKLRGSFAMTKPDRNNHNKPEAQILLVSQFIKCENTHLYESCPTYNIPPIPALANTLGKTYTTAKPFA